MIRRPPRSTLSSSSAASDVYKRQIREKRAGPSSRVTMIRPLQRFPRKAKTWVMAPHTPSSSSGRVTVTSLLGHSYCCFIRCLLSAVASRGHATRRFQMGNVRLLATRAVLGGYLSVHGAQKLFGAFDGPGLDATGAGFEAVGLRPGKAMATLAGASELSGGILTVTGIADPLGPLAIAGAMVVATSVHRKQGPMARKGGFELPLTNLALAL